MALENIEADNRESFCRFVLNRLDFLAEAYDLPVLESPDVAIAMLKGYQLALRDMGNPLAEYLEGWEF
jgi:hypothetical protein